MAVPALHPLSSSTVGRAGWKVWTGRVLTGLVALMMTFDAAIKIFPSKEAIEGTTQLGYQVHHLPIIGTIAAICLVLYLVPRTAPLGAVLLTGYFGGAIATQLRVDNPLFTHILAPVYISIILWTGLYLRDSRVRALIRPEE